MSEEFFSLHRSQSSALPSFSIFLAASPSSWPFFILRHQDTYHHKLGSHQTSPVLVHGILNLSQEKRDRDREIDPSVNGRENWQIGIFKGQTRRTPICGSSGRVVFIYSPWTELGDPFQQAEDIFVMMKKANKQKTKAWFLISLCS